MEYVETLSGIDVVTSIVPKNFSRAVLVPLCHILACDGSEKPRALCRRLGKRTGVMVMRACIDKPFYAAWYGELSELVDVAIEGGSESLEFVRELSSL